MKPRKIHKVFGLLLLLPLIGWSLTGAVFLIKPGYGGAYEQLTIKTYPLSEPVVLEHMDTWLEYRVFRSVLGIHVLAREASGWVHLDQELKLMAPPDQQAVHQLVQDAMSKNPDRYGRVHQVSDNTIQSDTGVTITLDWDSMSLYQEGEDSRLINILYKIHYLQWFGVDTLDRVFAIIGLLLLIALCVLGIMLSTKTGLRKTG